MKLNARRFRQGSLPGIIPFGIPVRFITPEKIRAEIGFGNIPKRLPKDGPNGPGCEFSVQRESQYLRRPPFELPAKLGVTASDGYDLETKAVKYLEDFSGRKALKPRHR
jgi:hypothetical protein